MQFEWNGDQVIDEMHRRIVGSMLAMADQVVQIAELYAPKRTGRLATSIGYDWNEATLTVVFTVGAPYGIFVEYGTRHSRPSPYLRPAINTVGSIYGFNTEMSFLNTPEIHQPILAHGADFALPPTLTPEQRAHVKRHLLPASQRHHMPNTNVSRTRMHARRREF